MCFNVKSTLFIIYSLMLDIPKYICSYLKMSPYFNNTFTIICRSNARVVSKHKLIQKKYFNFKVKISHYRFQQLSEILHLAYLYICTKGNTIIVLQVASVNCTTKHILLSFHLQHFYISMALCLPTF